MNSESTAGTISLLQPLPVPASNMIGQPPPEKRFKVVLNSDEIKNLIRAKDEEIRKQEEANRNRIAAAGMKIATPPMVTIPASALSQDSPDIKDEPMEEDDAGGDTYDEDDEEDDDDEGVDPLEQSLKPIVKPVVRKRAPVFPFEVLKIPSTFLLFSKILIFNFLQKYTKQNNFNSTLKYLQ